MLPVIALIVYLTNVRAAITIIVMATHAHARKTIIFYCNVLSFLPSLEITVQNLPKFATCFDTRRI